MKFGGKSIVMSMPKSKKVHGVIVKKIPLGKHLRMLEELQHLDKSILAELGRLKIDDLLDAIVQGKNAEIAQQIALMLAVVPTMAVKTLCNIFEIDYTYVSENLTAKEFTDVVMAFWQLNDLTDFFETAWGVVESLLTRNTGSKNGSQLQAK